MIVIFLIFFYLSFFFLRMYRYIYEMVTQIFTRKIYVLIIWNIRFFKYYLYL